MNHAALIGADLPSFEQIEELERLMLASGDVVEVKVRHLFAPGIYAREVFIPAGVAVIGALHKSEHISIVSKGRILVVSEIARAILEAPHSFVAPAGMKRCGYALEDTTWTTFHPTTSRDLAEIEERFIARTRDEFLQCANAEALCRG